MAIYRKTDWCLVSTVLARLSMPSGSNRQLQTPAQGQGSVCISGKMKSLAKALIGALVTTVFYCQWDSNTGNTRHRAKELAPSHSPGPWPMVGSFPRAQGRQLEGSWAPIQLSCCLYWCPGYPHPQLFFLTGSRNTNLFQLSVAGKARPPSLGCSTWGPHRNS